MIERPVLMGAPVVDRFLLVLSDLDRQFNDGDMISAEDVESTIARWAGPSCIDEAAEHTGNCCDQWRLSVLVWTAIEASQPD